MTIKEQARNEEILEALDLAKGIIGYCGADAWEMECTRADRNRFYEICEKYIPEPKLPEPIFQDCYCEVCNRHFIHKSALKSHRRGNKHKVKVAEKEGEI